VTSWLLVRCGNKEGWKSSRRRRIYRVCERLVLSMIRNVGEVPAQEASKVQRRVIDVHSTRSSLSGLLNQFFAYPLPADWSFVPMTLERAQTKRLYGSTLARNALSQEHCDRGSRLDDCRQTNWQPRRPNTSGTLFATSFLPIDCDNRSPPSSPVFPSACRFCTTVG